MGYHYSTEKYSDKIETNVESIVEYITTLCLELPKGKNFRFDLDSDIGRTLTLEVAVTSDNCKINFIYAESIDFLFNSFLSSDEQRTPARYIFPLTDKKYMDLCDENGNFKTEIPEYSEKGFLSINLYQELYKHLIMKWKTPSKYLPLGLKNALIYKIKEEDSTAFLDTFTV